jgi:hypothetical protein
LLLAKSGWASSRSNCSRIAAASSPEFGAKAIPHSFNPSYFFKTRHTHYIYRVPLTHNAPIPLFDFLSETRIAALVRSAVQPPAHFATPVQPHYVSYVQLKRLSEGDKPPSTRAPGKNTAK